MIDKIIKIIEENHNMEHACNCETWCQCWNATKDKLKRLENGGIDNE